jgi:hypothetical protein
MSRSIALLSAGLTALLASTAAAQATGSGMVGPRSSATIQITVSVAPRFAPIATNRGGKPSPADHADLPAFTSNLSKFRYSIVRSPAFGDAPSAANSPFRFDLVLITPE